VLVTALHSPVEAVEAEVRELVRRRGLDPIEDRAAMRRLVDEVVQDYDERSLTSSLPPLHDARSAARAVYDAVAGFGPLQATWTTRRSRRSGSTSRVASSSRGVDGPS
jgi:hypothetical protein